MKLKILICSYVFSLLLFGIKAKSQQVHVSQLLSADLNNRVKQSKLYFPKSVKRYYAQNGQQLSWINKKHEKQTFEAMLLLDCVLHYGLAHGDYHPAILTYDGLQDMLNSPDSVDAVKKVGFDIYLTDALITLINHLHYGKLNPTFSVKQRDELKKIKNFDVVNQLQKAIESIDFLGHIQSAQPKSKAYNDLQSYMRLIKGQYVGDCYEVPESEVRKIAINMERLRWRENGTRNFDNLKDVYLTCIIKDGLPIFYKDTRHLDKALEAAMYNTNQPLTSKIKVIKQLPQIQLKKN